MDTLSSKSYDKTIIEDLLNLEYNVFLLGEKFAAIKEGIFFQNQYKTKIIVSNTIDVNKLISIEIIVHYNGIPLVCNRVIQFEMLKEMCIPFRVILTKEIDTMFKIIEDKIKDGF